MFAKLLSRWAAYEAQKRIEPTTKMLKLPEYQETEIRNILISVRWQAKRELDRMEHENAQIT